MDDSLLALLRSVDTPTVCNAIEVAEGMRGFDRFTRGTVLCSDPDAGAIVGYARTARIAGAAPSEDAPETVRAVRMDYYRHMASGERPALAVIEDLDGTSAVGAYWGEVNATVHKGFGLCGAVTNGVMRDLGDLPEGFPVIAGSIGPSHGFVHVKEVGMPVTVFGLTVSDGDLVHADRHGALVVPKDCIEVLAEAIKRMQETEQIVLSAARAPGFGFQAFEEAWAAFERARV